MTTDDDSSSSDGPRSPNGPRSSDQWRSSDGPRSPDEWASSFDELAQLAGVERQAPSSWPKREQSMRHVCRLLAFQLDAAADAGPRRRELARAYARGFAMYVEAGRRHAETDRPPP